MRDDLKKALDEIDKENTGEIPVTSVEKLIKMIKKAAESGAEIKIAKIEGQPPKEILKMLKDLCDSDIAKNMALIESTFQKICINYIDDTVTKERYKEAKESEDSMKGFIFSIVMSFMLTVLTAKLIAIKKERK